MDVEFTNPCNSEARLGNWPPRHDIGVYISIGEVLILVGTAAGRADLVGLLKHLAVESVSSVYEPPSVLYPDWFFADVDGPLVS